MRASGRGGRQGPRGDPVPPRALLRLWGMCPVASLAVLGCAHRPLPRSGGRLLLRAGLFCGLGDNEWL